MSVLTIEETYFILKEYLDKIQTKSNFQIINNKSDFHAIGTLIDKVDDELRKMSRNADLSIDQLHTQLAVIIYLSDLSYFYIQNSGYGYLKIVGFPADSKTRLTTIKEILNEKIKTFKNDLKYLVDEEGADNLLNQLVNCYINYLQTVVDIKVSPFAEFAGKLVGGIDFDNIKSEAKKDIDSITKLLKENQFFDAVEGEQALPCSTSLLIQNLVTENDEEFFDAVESLDAKELIQASPPLDATSTETTKDQMNSSSKRAFIQNFLVWLRKLILNIRNKLSSDELNRSSPIISKHNSEKGTISTVNNFCTFYRILTQSLLGNHLYPCIYTFSPSAERTR